jgi:hypothetical protein
MGAFMTLKPDVDVWREIIRLGGSLMAVDIHQDEATGKWVKKPVCKDWQKSHNLPITKEIGLDSIGQKYLACGFHPMSIGLVAIDIDKKHDKDGEESLIRALGGEPEWLRWPSVYVDTPNGRHLFFKRDGLPEGLLVHGNGLLPGVDYRGTHDGWLVAPGSVGWSEGMESLRRYELNGDFGQAPEMPAELQAVLLGAMKPKNEAITGVVAPVDALIPAHVRALQGGPDTGFGDDLDGIAMLFAKAKEIQKNANFFSQWCEKVAPEGVWNEAGDYCTGDIYGKAGSSCKWTPSKGLIKDFGENGRAYDVLDWIATVQDMDKIQAARAILAMVGEPDPSVGAGVALNAGQRTQVKASADTASEMVSQIPLSSSTPIPAEWWAQFAEANPGHCHFIQKASRFKPVNTKEAFAFICYIYGVNARHNLMTHEVEITLPGFSYRRDRRNASLADITSICHLNLMPVEAIPQYIEIIAYENEFHPVVEWLSPIVWDGKDRIEALKKTLVVRDGDEAIRDCVVEKWLISCIAAIYHPKYRGRGVLTLQGAQGQGKTSWFRNLVPHSKAEWFKEGMSLDPRNKDTVLSSISSWIVELGEIGSTFRKADIDSLKAFLTSDTDTIRAPYARTYEVFQRRTVFCGTVNERESLNDMTGNSRFWVVGCQSIVWNHGIDMEQLWAQVKSVYDNRVGGDAVWWLDNVEERILATHVTRFEYQDETVDAFQTLYGHDVYSDDTPGARLLSSTEIMQELVDAFHHLKPKKNVLCSWLRGKGYHEKRTMHKRGFVVGPIIDRNTRGMQAMIGREDF